MEVVLLGSAHDGGVPPCAQEAQLGGFTHNPAHAEQEILDARHSRG
jgi:hypothetical protein